MRKTLENKKIVLQINIKGLDRLNELLKEIEDLELEVEVNQGKED